MNDLAKRKKKKTMFGPPKHKTLAKIITIRNLDEAKQAAQYLIGESSRMKRPSAILRRAQAAQLAANRARAQLKRENLSRKERAEMREIAALWDWAAKRMFSIYHRKKGGGA